MFLKIGDNVINMDYCIAIETPTAHECTPQLQVIMASKESENYDECHSFEYPTYNDAERARGAICTAIQRNLSFYLAPQPGQSVNLKYEQQCIYEEAQFGPDEHRLEDSFKR